MNLDHQLGKGACFWGRRAVQSKVRTCLGSGGVRDEIMDGIEYTDLTTTWQLPDTWKASQPPIP